jgi:hypothetical protein
VGSRPKEFPYFKTGVEKNFRTADLVCEFRLSWKVVGSRAAKTRAPPALVVLYWPAFSPAPAGMNPDAAGKKM